MQEEEIPCGINQPNLIEDIIRQHPEITLTSNPHSPHPPETDKNHKTDIDFRSKSNLSGRNLINNVKGKAASQKNVVKQEVMRQHLEKNNRELKRKEERAVLPNIQSKKASRSRTQVRQIDRSHHFDRKNYQRQLIGQDIQKHPLKYKIMCQVFGCKPEIAYTMPKEEAFYIQEGYTKLKGAEYMKQGNSRARYNYIRDRRVHTEHNSKSVKSISQRQIKNNVKSQKILKLSAKEAIEGKVVYDRVKKHLKESPQNHNYFNHLSSEESIDQALVNFLKTKIQRAEMVIK